MIVGFFSNSSPMRPSPVGQNSPTYVAVLLCLVVALSLASCSHLSSDEGAPATDNGGSGQVVSSTSAEELLSFARAGDARSVDALLESGISPNSTDTSDMTPLIWAAWGDHLETVKLLVTHRADIDKHDNRGKTALMAAAWQGNAEIVRFLLEHGANANAKDHEGDTALLKAVRSNGNDKTVQTLLEHGAAIEARDASGRTPLMSASFNGHLRTVEVLVAHGAADDYQTGGHKFNARRLAAWGGHPDIVAFLSALHPRSPEVDSSVYESGNPGQSVVEGAITFKGPVPFPTVVDLAKFGNTTYCSQVDTDEHGHRVIQDVRVTDGHLGDVVVYIRGITRAKPFIFDGTDVKIDRCRFLVQGGPSAVVGVVVKGAEIRIVNDDADPANPKAVTGVLHNPHAYERKVGSISTIFNLPLPGKGQTLIKTVILRENDSTLILECDQHNYERAFFYPVENPYYAIVGPDGNYVIDRVPAGKYEMIAWHPFLGVQKKVIEVGATGRVTVDFEFSWPKT